MLGGLAIPHDAPCILYLGAKGEAFESLDKQTVLIFHIHFASNVSCSRMGAAAVLHTFVWLCLVLVAKDTDESHFFKL